MMTLLLTILLLAGCSPTPNEPIHTPTHQSSLNLPEFDEPRSVMMSSSQRQWVLVLNKEPVKNKTSTFSQGESCVADMAATERVIPYDHVFLVNGVLGAAGTTCPNGTVVFLKDNHNSK